METTGKNPAFCILPWVHMYVDPTGDVFSCCIHTPDIPPLGNIHQETPEQIWNGSKMRELRKDFMSGKRRPDNCASCYFNEAAKNDSHRINFNSRFSEQQAELLPLTTEDGHLSEMKLKHWDFRFSNTCNLKCRTCGPEYSSSWRDDAKKMGRHFEPDKRIFNTYEFAMRHIESVEEIYFAGGEPLLMKEHFDILNELCRLNRKKVRLSYNSNLSTLRYGKHSIVDLWKNFENILISPSVDHIGAKAEYIRKGIHWETFVENVTTLGKEIPWARMSPTVTVSVFNIMEISEIHRNLVAMNIVHRDRPADLEFNILRVPDFYSIAILPPELKKVAEERISAYRAELLSKSNIYLPAFDNVLRALREDLSQQIPHFLKTTETLDKIRGESFFDLFPEYEILKQYA
jgi:radical SAM protein with 4Fe4S-binding SPASM domain